jgi:hypothetical protein
VSDANIPPRGYCYKCKQGFFGHGCPNNHEDKMTAGGSKVPTELYEKEIAKKLNKVLQEKMLATIAAAHITAEHKIHMQEQVTFNEQVLAKLKAKDEEIAWLKEKLFEADQNVDMYAVPWKEELEKKEKLIMAVERINNDTEHDLTIDEIRNIIKHAMGNKQEPQVPNEG